ncbi:uncharacterized protein LOC106407462 isoform X2 [Brassica napus]|uniref:uncharacterized protein LOC106407462 isoform X2 n=1 Tax=Brassica napus TaxID=3708 RepID=UPI00207A50F0|nr:uncharacterized protein LOC106407462 isoform X2 [Brassica napus]
MAAKLNLIVFSIVMLHHLISVQMHPIHSKSPAPQPHPPQSQPRHNSSQNGTTEGSLQLQGTEMEEELRDMKAHKAYISMVDFVAEAQQGIPKLCPCGSITKETVDEEDTYDYLPGKRYFICKDFENDGLHFRQPWVTGVTEEVERLKLRVHEHEKLLRECEALKAQVAMLVKRVTELELLH